MPSFDLLNNVELFVKHGKFPADATKSCKQVTKAASKKFIFKDGFLWRHYRGRLLRVVKSDEEVKEIMIRFHDNNNHVGRIKVVKEIMLMFYWVGVTEVAKAWINKCEVCQNRVLPETKKPSVQFCFVYGCESSSSIYPELSFHRFPEDKEIRQRWLSVAQRDENSLRSNSFLCSKHFEPSCFTLSNEVQLTLSPDAVPTIIPETEQEDQGPVPSEEDFLFSNSLEDLFSKISSPPSAMELQEHQYCLQDPEPTETHKDMEQKRRFLNESSFKVFNHIARYLSHRVLPMQNKKGISSLKRMTNRFALKDGVLMYTIVSPPVRVLRSREEVNSILRQFHDDQDHSALVFCQREITKRFFWARMTRDVARWISCCQTCMDRTKRRWLRCSMRSCTNSCGPVERGLGLTFHKFPLDDTPLLHQWMKAVGRPNWFPRLGSSVCSSHFSEECFDRSGEKVAVRSDAVPTLMVHGNQETPLTGPTQPAVDETYFSKYDAVELYLIKRTYPPGLSYVEKNTFRRFCKRYCIKGDSLHTERGNRLCLVLRSRKKVEEALLDFHDELNHLNVNKCLRLLNERYFWKTMRPDVVQWINKCSECSRKTKKKKKQGRPPTGTFQSPLQTLRPPHTPEDSDSGKDGDDGEDGGDEDVGDEERGTVEDRGETPLPPQPRIPILVHLKTPIHFHSSTPITLQPTTSNALSVERLFQKETLSSSSVNHLIPEQKETIISHVKARTLRRKTKKKRGRTPTGTFKSPLQTLRPPHTPEDLDSENDGDDGDDDDDGDEERGTAPTLEDRGETPLPPQPRIPILVHLKTPIHFHSSTPITLQPTTSNALSVERLFQKETLSSSSVNSEQTGPQEQKEIVISHVSARTLHFVRVQDIINPLPESNLPPELTAKHKPPQSKSKTMKPPSQGRGVITQTKSCESAQQPKRRRKKDLEADQITSSGGSEPLLAPSSKPWPVFTISDSSSTQSAKPPTNVDSAPLQRNITLQARIVLQQCSEAKVKAAAQWAEIQKGLVVYVCFFHGATEDVTHEMARSLMTTTFFRKDSGHSVSVLDFPGSVLFIHQDSLLGEGLPKGRMENRGGGQLFSTLISKCREKMAASEKCRKAGVKVEHGEYGKKQEVSLKSAEPMTLLMEF
ncbi:hypothetical protein OYC64_009083 [Pagothenia borchgrevinki]|uniref:THAP domain-containing protein 1 n=1 Tax=Pagothenia borchgrevinki TaxID=8213 RepID=A0ABD2G733_PAGBO